MEDNSADEARGLRLVTMISGLMSQMQRIEGKVDLLEERIEANNTVACRDLDALTEKIMAALELRDVKQASVNADLVTRVDLAEAHLAVLDHRVEALEARPAKLAIAGWKKIAAIIGSVGGGVLIAYIAKKLGLV